MNNIIYRNNWIKLERSKSPIVWINLSSGDDEYIPGCRLSFKTFNRILALRLPTWILKPDRGEKQLDNGEKIRYCIERQYSISLSYNIGFLNIHYGRIETPDYTDDKRVSFNLHFLEERLTAKYSLNNDKTIFKTLEPKAYKLGDEILETDVDYPPIKFLFTKKNKGVLEASCKITKRIWQKGTHNFEWMSRFCKPRLHTVMEINFSEEIFVGRGMAYGETTNFISEEETGEQAFKRYCLNNSLTFIGIT